MSVNNILMNQLDSVQVPVFNADEQSPEIQSDTKGETEGDSSDSVGGGEDQFAPSPIDYMVRQQQLATFQMLSEFLTYRDDKGNHKNITEIANEIRISIDVLAKAILQVNKTMEKCLSQKQ